MFERSTILASSSRISASRRAKWPFKQLPKHKLQLRLTRYIEDDERARESRWLLIIIDYSQQHQSIAGSLNTWGWVVLCIGVVEWAVDWRVIVKSPLSLWVGVIVLGLNAIVQLMMIPAYPFWSLSVFTLDIPRDVRPGCVWRATLERRLSMPNPAFPAIGVRQWSSVQGDTYPLTTAAASPTLATPGPSRPRPPGRSGRWSGGGRRSGSGAPGMRDWPPEAAIAACATGPWPLLPTKESGPRADCSPRSLSTTPASSHGSDARGRFRK